MIRLFLLFVLMGCASRPVKEMLAADVALKAAQKAKADSSSSDLFRRAENYYWRAKKDYRDGYFDSAKKNAEEARLAAERAEYDAVQKQQSLQGPPDSPAPWGESSEPVAPR